MNLYTDYAQSFSNTRSFAWEGWNKIVEFFPKNRPLRVLDVGCGNGRFFNFIKNTVTGDFHYLGIDNSESLLATARENITDPNAVFQFSDISDDSWTNHLESYDLIVCFGVLHHIQTKEKRTHVISEMHRLLAGQASVLITTFWQFAENASFLQKHMIDPDRKMKSEYVFEENDYILSFGNQNAWRFCHSFTDEEVNAYYNTYDVVDTFQADGFEGKMNRYMVSRFKVTSC